MTLSNKFINACGAVALAGIAGAILYGFASLAFASGLPYNVTSNIEIIGIAQKNASDAHLSLEKAREVTRAAIEAENAAQSIVDGYSKTANEARKAICSIEDGKYCIRENLDPMNTQINLEQFFQTGR